MSMGYRDDPNCVLSYNVGNVVREDSEIHSTITFSSQPRQFRKSTDPIHHRRNLVPEPQPKP